MTTHASTEPTGASPSVDDQTPPRTTGWTARRLFDEISALGPLRVIAVTGPSVFETICELHSFGTADGWLNAITPDYHWHLDLRRVRHLATRDQIHQRSGRRVLFFELCEEAGSEPFLLVYLHRGKGEELAPEREERFAALHRVFASGGPVDPGLRPAPTSEEVTP